ncbi:prolyl oligopeptidase family serine peptidase [candidate division KSB1 bacterium]|nr:S9 family peptidase [candidate division KSB1 bacterium]NIS28335.1 S9 family peptidase [candidate division KSB1 bacterium]NIU29067.1 S9 family peptidase [candidate division KSB1 bacterium]NIU93587.1 prolyl oligopeptidase family serine peptidase [candidate division KSB1 bacterium]NIV97289.1 prolyl oligopeptidase family serine peptidase [candidate division KSB1 bacterium]
MIKFKRVSDPAVSPDGRLIAYTISTPIMDKETSEYLTHIWVVSSDGKRNQQFTRGDESCANPSFSPDGRYFAFTTARGEDGKNQIWVLSLKGGEAEQITQAEDGVNAYAWSPDGKRIAYTMNDPETELEKDRKKAKLDMKVLDTNYKYAHLYTITVDKDVNGDREVQRLTSGNFHIGSLFGTRPFDWSPDGRIIAFEHRINPKIDEWPTTDISTVPSDSGAVTPLVTFSGADMMPRYSPDGKWLACVSDGGNPRWAFAIDIYIVPAKGGEPQKLAETPDRFPRLIGWSDDSKEVLFAETDQTSRRVFVLPRNGTPPEMFTLGRGNFINASLSQDGETLAFIHETTDTPSEVHVTSTGTFDPKKLTNIHSDYPKFRMGKTEAITWTSKDGLEIEGLLTYPVNHVLDRLHPLILQIHGGPAGVFTETYTARSSGYPIQAFAQQGYAVLRANPRGSSGYGKEFRFANYNDWGFGDYDDLIAGVNKVVGLGVAHPDSLCVMGWSYGGYMTSFIVTKSNRFKAASVGAGVTNLFSFAGTADIPSFLPDYFGGEPWDRLDTYMKHSAMFQIQDVTIPTQIIHGEEDERVPISQGHELYNALKRQGCPTEMIVYPRTSHGVREPKFIQDIGERVIAWFNRHLDRKGRAEPVVTK